jgi:hypothetical protein
MAMFLVVSVTPVIRLPMTPAKQAIADPETMAISPGALDRFFSSKPEGSRQIVDDGQPRFRNRQIVKMQWFPVKSMTLLER